MSTVWHDEAIRFSCGVGEKHYTHHPVVTGPYACVSPVSGSEIKKTNSVAVPQRTLVLQDSGALSDACLPLRGQSRQTFKKALKRQEHHATGFNYQDQMERTRASGTHR